MIDKLTYYYVSVMASIKKYNLQSIAINKFVQKINKQDFINQLNKPLDEFNRLYSPFLARDIIFKSNSITTRNSILISPAHYFYYTKLVYDLIIHENKKQIVHIYKNEFSESYYSGLLYYNMNDIDKKRKILFDYSYNLYRKRLKEFEGKQAFVIDLENFFDSIKVDKLIDILNDKYDRESVSKIKLLFETLQINTLPQFHYSIVSSILSQEYLSCFDQEVSEILKDNNLYMVRFVDDMHIFNMGDRLNEGKIHSIIDYINRILWRNNLKINSEKIKLFVDTPYSIELVKDSYDDLYYNNEKRIEEKSKSLITDGFIKFIQKANKLYYNKGYNVKEFTELFKCYFSIENQDATKVLNNFVFKNRWKELSDTELKYIIYNYEFIFFLPNIFLTLYLMIYEFYENKHGRNEKTIRELLGVIDQEYKSSLRYLYSSLHYLIQRGFKRSKYIREISFFNAALGEYLEQYIIE